MGCAYSQVEDASFPASAGATAQVTLQSQLGAAKADLKHSGLPPSALQGDIESSAETWLPDDLWFKILASLSDENIARAQLVCRHFKALGDELAFKRPNLYCHLSKLAYCQPQSGDKVTCLACSRKREQLCKYQRHASIGT